MRILITGASGFVGAALIPRLQRDGHELRALARDPDRVRADLAVVRGDAVSGEGLAQALDGIDVAYYLVHSMEAAADGAFDERDRRAALGFAAAASAAGVQRIVYLGGLVPADGRASRHLASRLEVERILLDALPASVALRASIVIAARSRSFRFLVRLVERLPVLALPAWREHRTQPIDGRDALDFLVAAATAPELAGRSLDIAGPEPLSYGEMLLRIAELMLVQRPALRLDVRARSVASRVSAAIAGEDPALIAPLMESLDYDLLPRPNARAPAEAFGIRLHSFDAAVERALRDWERAEPLRAR